MSYLTNRGPMQWVREHMGPSETRHTLNGPIECWIHGLCAEQEILLTREGRDWIVRVQDARPEGLLMYVKFDTRSLAEAVGFIKGLLACAIHVPT